MVRAFIRNSPADVFARFNRDPVCARLGKRRHATQQTDTWWRSPQPSRVPCPSTRAPGALESRCRGRRMREVRTAQESGRRHARGLWPADVLARLNSSRQLPRPRTMEGSNGVSSTPQLRAPTQESPAKLRWFGRGTRGSDRPRRGRQSGDSVSKEARLAPAVTLAPNVTSWAGPRSR